MREKKHSVHIETASTPDGTFRAYCPEIEGLEAEGETPQAAEAVLTRLIETHMECEVDPTPHLDVAGDPDAVFGATREER